MELKSVDRTKELEQRLKAIQVNSEDTCVFWQTRDDFSVGLKRCFYCAYYYCIFDKPNNCGLCKFKQNEGVTKYNP